MFQARLTVNDEGNEQTVLVHAGKAYRDFAAVHTIVEHACPGRNCDATVFPRKGGTTDGNNHIRADHFVTNPKKKAHAAHCAYDGSRERGKGTVSLSHALEHGLPVILNINIKALRRELPDVRDKKEYNDHRNRKLDYKDYATYSIKDIRDLFSFLERLGTQHAMTGMKSPAWISYKRTLRPIEDCYLGDSTAAIARYIKGAMKRTEHAKKRKKERGKNYAPSLPMLVALDFEKAADVDGQYYSQPVMLPHLPERPFFDEAMRNAAMMPHVMRFRLEISDPKVAGAVDYALASGREIVVMAAPEHDIRSAIYGAMHGHKPKQIPPALPAEFMGHRQIVLPVRVADNTQIQTFKLQQLGSRG